MKYILSVLLFPITFIITLPIEFPLWKEYKKQGYNVPGYLKFFWDRCLMFKEQHFTNSGEQLNQSL